jgi:guanosine-3',5'-bis(diphosphate) 3'-pyrophosphohydrolase
MQTMDTMGNILAALAFAAAKHRDQRRKDREASPYINHPIEVVRLLWHVGGIRDEVALVAAVLHDTVEDTDTTFEEIEAQFGAEVRAVVAEVTDDKSLPKDERKQLQISKASAKSERAKVVKLADKLSNVTDLVNSPPEKWPGERRRQYVVWAQQVVDQLRGTNEGLEGRFDELCKRALGEFDS